MVMFATCALYAHAQITKGLAVKTLNNIPYYDNAELAAGDGY